MTNEQILKKAIEKAIKNGWKKVITYNAYRTTVSIQRKHYFRIIFSHDFAKAFFGLDFTKEGTYFQVKPWMYHLQIMVIEPEPLKYLERLL